MLYTLLLSLLSLYPTISHAADDAYGKAPNRFQETVITAATLAQCSASLPDTIKDVMNNPEQKALFEYLCFIPDAFNNMQTIQEDRSEKEALLNQAGHNNKSAYNIVIEIVDAHIVKISGVVNRLQSMLITRDIEPGKWGAYSNGPGTLVAVKEEEVTPFSMVKIPTYQTASRFRNYLLCKECIDQYELKTVDVPKTYLFLFDTTQEPHDENCVVIQEKKEAPRCDTQKLTSDQITDLFRLIEQVGLWTLKDLLQKDDTVYVIDLEQPNNANPDYFFERNDYEYQGNVKSGIDQLINLCQHDPKKMALIAQLVKSSKHIDHFDDRWKREISLLL